MLQTEIIPFVVHLMDTTGLWLYVLQYSQKPEPHDILVQVSRRLRFPFVVSYWW